MQAYLGVFLGGAIGSVFRFWLSGWITQKLNNLFPWGVLAVNVIGCFVIGFFATLTGSEGIFLVSPTIRKFVMVGILGGFTTFSSFSLETFYLMQDGQWFHAALNVLISVALCLIAVVLGHNMAMVLNNR